MRAVGEVISRNLQRHLQLEMTGSHQQERDVCWELEIRQGQKMSGSAHPKPLPRPLAPAAHPQGTRGAGEKLLSKHNLPTPSPSLPLPFNPIPSLPLPPRLLPLPLPPLHPPHPLPTPIHSPGGKLQSRQAIAEPAQAT